MVEVVVLFVASVVGSMDKREAILLLQESRLRWAALAASCSANPMADFCSGVYDVYSLRVGGLILLLGWG